MRCAMEEPEDAALIVFVCVAVGTESAGHEVRVVFDIFARDVAVPVYLRTNDIAFGKEGRPSCW